jgi:hypothetical protein
MIHSSFVLTGSGPERAPASHPAYYQRGGNWRGNCHEAIIHCHLGFSPEIWQPNVSTLNTFGIGAGDEGDLAVMMR